MLPGLICTGWLLLMNSEAPNYNHQITTTVICVQTEKQCRYLGGVQESSLRNDHKLETNKFFSFTCTDMSVK